MKNISLTLFLIGFLSGCAGSYNRNFNPNEQSALVYLGANPGNRLLFFNGDRFPKLNVYRKTQQDTTFSLIDVLHINQLPYRYKIGYNGPGFAYDWNDLTNSETTTRYKVFALDDSSRVLVELKIIYGAPDGNGSWKHLKE